MMYRVLKRLRAVLRDQDGNTTIEFVILSPVLFLVLASTAEIAIANVRAVLLERATDLVVRELRLTGGKTHLPDQASMVAKHNALKKAICDVATMVPRCKQSLQIEMQPVDLATWDVLKDDVDCVDRAKKIDPVLNFKNGRENEMMLIRVCAVVDPLFPTFGLGRAMKKDASGAYKIVAKTAFVNEPD